jgi:hypothetical protein
MNVITTMNHVLVYTLSNRVTIEWIEIFTELETFT